MKITLTLNDEYLSKFWSYTGATAVGRGDVIDAVGRRSDVEVVFDLSESHYSYSRLCSNRVKKQAGECSGTISLEDFEKHFHKEIGQPLLTRDKKTVVTLSPSANGEGKGKLFGSNGLYYDLLGICDSARDKDVTHLLEVPDGREVCDFKFENVQISHNDGDTFHGYIRWKSRIGDADLYNLKRCAGVPGTLTFKETGLK